MVELTQLVVEGASQSSHTLFPACSSHVSAPENDTCQTLNTYLIQEVECYKGLITTLMKF